MRKLTFKGFLEPYLIELSYGHTCSVSKLIKELSDNPRLKEPLAVYSVLNNSTKKIRSKAPELYAECEIVEKNISDISLISEKYLKLYNAYAYACSKKKNDDDSKKMMRNRILSIQAEKGISNYRIYIDLKMNPGNVNSFLKKGDCNKLSLDNVRKIWNYVEKKNTFYGGENDKLIYSYGSAKTWN